MSNFKISIPEPCHENWNEMTPTEKGRFCGSCQKEVTDFSKMTKVEIKKYFTKQIGQSTCGRFESRQLAEFNRQEIEPRKLNSKPWWIAAATIFMFAKQGVSQEKPQVVNQPKVELSKSPVAMEAPKENMTDPGDEIMNDSLVYVSGQVLGFEGDTIYAATVRIKDTNIGCVTDFDGKFKLLIPKEFQDSLTLEVSFVGYLNKTISYKNINNSKNVGEIKLDKEMELMIFGGIQSIQSVTYREEPTLKARAKNIWLRMFR